VRMVLRRVDDGRLGRAIAGLVTRGLSVEDVVRRDKEVYVLVRSSGKTGVREFGMCIRGTRSAAAAAISADAVYIASISLRGGAAIQDVEM